MSSVFAVVEHLPIAGGVSQHLTHGEYPTGEAAWAAKAALTAARPELVGCLLVEMRVKKDEPPELSPAAAELAIKIVARDQAAAVLAKVKGELDEAADAGRAGRGGAGGEAGAEGGTDADAGGEGDVRQHLGRRPRGGAVGEGARRP